MKYQLICFTFNEVPTEASMRLQLRNNWVDAVPDEESLYDALSLLGIHSTVSFPNSNPVVKLSGSFALPNTRIIVHVVTMFR